jgi:uncharacterized membrane protein YdjX (TVP38/TMEM64 family)
LFSLLLATECGAGATILTLAGGAIFGFFTGTILVSFASTIGATLAFLASRFLLRDFVQTKFSERIRNYLSTTSLLISLCSHYFRELQARFEF